MMREEREREDAESGTKKEALFPHSFFFCSGVISTQPAASFFYNLGELLAIIKWLASLLAAAAIKRRCVKSNKTRQFSLEKRKKERGLFFPPSSFPKKKREKRKEETHPNEEIPSRGFFFPFFSKIERTSALDFY